MFIPFLPRPNRQNSNLSSTSKAKFVVMGTTPKLFIVAAASNRKLGQHIANAMMDAVLLGFNPQKQHFLFAESNGEFCLVRPRLDSTKYALKWLRVRGMNEAKVKAMTYIKAV